MTTPAAMNAPTMPRTRPRMIGLLPMNFQPSHTDLSTDGDEILSLTLRLAISWIMNTVTAEMKYVAALKYSARSTLLVLKYGVRVPRALLTRASTLNRAAATGAVPYVVSRLSWLARSSLSRGTRL